MAKKKKAKRLHKTLVEQILDKNKVPYKQYEFATHMAGDTAQMDVDHAEVDEHRIYKTLVLGGNVTGPLVGVVPIDEHLDEKKLAKASGNKKVDMIPLKNLLKTTGYEHGANTPVGIWEKKQFPIYLDQTAHEQGQILVSSGQIGRSVEVNADDLATLVHGTFTDLLE